MPYVAYKFRMVPNQAMHEQLTVTLDLCRELYNAALQERRDAYQMRKKSITYLDQANQLPALKEVRPEYQDIGSQVLQDICQRVDKAFGGFFLRIKRGQKAGYPRFKGAKRYNSFTFPSESGWAYETGGQHKTILFKKTVRANVTQAGHLTISKLAHLGTIRVRQHRPMEGTIKTCEIVREGPHWYVVFVCAVAQAVPLPLSHEDIGLDVGIKTYAACSDGKMIENPRWYRQAEDQLDILQKARSTKKKDSCRYRKLSRQLAILYRHVANQRKDFQHKETKKIVDRYQIMALEDLHIKNLSKRPEPKQEEITGAYLPNGAAAKAGLNKSIIDAAWGQFAHILAVKAAKAGRTCIFVNPRNTTQRCSGCKKLPSQKIALDVRTYVCEHCGLVLDRDVNAARTILDEAYEQIKQCAGSDAPAGATQEAPYRSA